jgi:hypothetical protein
MDRKTILSKFLQDPLLQELLNIDEEALKNVSFSEVTGNDTIDIIKNAVFIRETHNGNSSPDIIVRKLNQYFDQR